jgi:hypothetical protein
MIRTTSFAARRSKLGRAVRAIVLGTAALTAAPASAANDRPSAALATPAEPPAARPELRLPESPRLSEGTRVALPPTMVPLDRPPVDHRPVYVGAAIVMLAVALWWNRQRRDRFDREDRAERRAPAARPRRSRDDDADDLHAAARDDAPDSPDGRPAP